MKMKPSRSLYSSSLTYAPFYCTSDIDATTNSPSSGRDLVSEFAMEEFLHHSKTSTTVQPTKSGLPPCGLVRVAPQTEHEITIFALEKIVVSLPQSLQDTFRNELAIIFHLSCRQVRISLLFGKVRSEPFQFQCICIKHSLF